MNGRSLRRSSSGRGRRTVASLHLRAPPSDIAEACGTGKRESPGKRSLLRNPCLRLLLVNTRDDAFNRRVLDEQVMDWIVPGNPGDEIRNAHTLRIECEVETPSLPPDQLNVGIDKGGDGGIICQIHRQPT